MSLSTISWVLYIVGFVIVAASWVNLVSGQVGWVGFAIGMVGWVMQYLPGYRQATISEELERLRVLHDQGALTDEEFEAAKRSVVGGDAPSQQ